ncbi:MAG: type II toxin-antitoxin system RelE/ParE family toxin [Bacteroidales bacterium]|jgi:plasmid stabilization system protein ParE|nr:type II toxin-antitoxin system RelE/ParE family toxin [Bacteroidales bacterium]MDD4217668.1 type II toxin-antitoxin system RelE/ParE family toxin [Bacteroidales bacterium]MDY0142948.1 type II toxin-antitoxin system RelE/ParE family toxin [Bacteroidales bacterium]
MKNISKVLWTQEANKNLSIIIKYLEDNWTKKEIEKFLKKLNKHISIIQSQPDSFPKTNNYNVRQSVVTKQITLYYSISQDTLNIVSLFDNRQDPQKLKI